MMGKQRVPVTGRAGTEAAVCGRALSSVMLLFLVMAPVVLISSSGCALISIKKPGVNTTGAVPQGPSSEPDHRHADIYSELVALDFVNAIVQIESLAPDRTLLQFARTEREDPVLDTLRNMLSEAGYGIRRVGSDVAVDRLVTHRVTRNDARSRRHEISIGDIGLRRAYQDVGSGRVRPVSALLVRGAAANRIRMMDDILFGLDRRPVPAPETGGASAGNDEASDVPTLSRRLTSRYEYLFDRSSSDAMTLATESTGSADETATRQPVSGAGSLKLDAAGNVQQAGASNFAEIFADFNPIVEHLIDFAPSSDRLDVADVVLIDDVLERFDAASDLISITGYSTGGTSNIAANRRMALHRARRVKAAFTRMGVPAGQVLVEGYWSLSNASDEPARAARLRLLRRIPS